jgi:hypothetical protein
MLSNEDLSTLKLGRRNQSETHPKINRGNLLQKLLSFHKHEAWEVFEAAILFALKFFTTSAWERILFT